MSSSSEPHPKKIKTDKGAKAAKPVDTLIVNDTGLYSSKIERELQSNLIGVIKLYRDNVDPSWTSTNGLQDENRSVDTAAVDKLHCTLATQLDRVLPRHFMNATIVRDQVSALLSALEIDSLMVLQNKSTEFEYPLMTLDAFAKFTNSGGTPLTLQAGQHCFQALRIKVNTKDAWWPAKLYYGDISLGALDCLCENVKDTQTELNDRGRVLKLWCYQQGMDNLKLYYLWL